MRDEEKVIKMGELYTGRTLFREANIESWINKCVEEVIRQGDSMQSDWKCCCRWK